MKEIFEPVFDETAMGYENHAKTNGFEIRVFEDGRGGYFILDTVTSEMWKTTDYEAMVEFTSERVVRATQVY